MGLLAGLGVIPIPGVDSITYSLSPGFILTSTLTGLLAGGLTGAILGTAFRLLRSKDKVSIASQGIKRGGLLLVTGVDQMNNEETARHIMKQYGAADLQNLTERWDTYVWAELDEAHPSNPDQ